MTPSFQKSCIFGLGTVVVDHQVFLDQFPAPDTKGEILEDRYQVGGPVPTALTLLSKWGYNASFQGVWAQDLYGEMIEKDLLAHGIHFQHPPLEEGLKSGFAHVWVERSSGRRTIACHRGNSFIVSDLLDSGSIANAGVLLLDGWSGQAAIKAAQIVKSNGGKVFMDLGSPKPALEELLALVDHLNCPEGLLKKLFPNASLAQGAKKLLSMGPREITITQGDDGAWHFCAGCSFHQPAFPIVAVDTNGAGDVFSAALIHGALTGMMPKEKLRFASAVSALKCQMLGNRESLPQLKEVESFLIQAH